MVKREDFLPNKMTLIDKKMIKVFKKSGKEVNALFLEAVASGDVVKSRMLMGRIQQIHRTLIQDFGTRVSFRIPQEYLRGVQYADLAISGNISNVELKIDGDEIRSLIPSSIESIGPIHKEAVMSLVDNGNRLIHSNIRNIESNILYKLAQFQKIQVKERIAQDIVMGSGTGKMKQNILKELKLKGVSGFKDKAGRFRSTERYSDMIVRTETAIANSEGTVNRGLQLGFTKFKVHEHHDSCSICAFHNGKTYDMSKGEADLPPYHPNCEGFTTIIVE